MRSEPEEATEMDSRERRATGVRRVSLETLVEICGMEGAAPAFEAESLDVSGRGMQVRTAYLPDEGAPLVCRFEDRGREVVVEGVVAWRRELARGGEFGIKFTALDAGSVDVLRELCTAADPEQAAEAEAETDADSEVEDSPLPDQAPPGTRVRMHIDGLGAPMKARVREGGVRRLQVGSNLEFLKVGKHLDLENLEQASRRSARIEAVGVSIDPQTQVPQLVVSLRYDDVDETPEPAVLDNTPASATCRSPAQPAYAENELDEMACDDDDLPPEEEVAEEAGALKARLDGVAASAGVAAKSTGAVLARAGSTAASGIGRLFKGAGVKLAEVRKKRADQHKNQPRRATAPPPSGVLSVDGRRLRPQRPVVSEAAPAAPAEVDPSRKKKRARKIAAAGAAAVLAISVGAIAMRDPAPPPGERAEAAPPTESVVLAAGDDVTEVDEQGNPTPPRKKGKKLVTGKADKPPSPSKGPVAEVPLFGPTPMATMEPAPLGPPPEELLGDDAPSASKAVADEAFADEATKKVDPEDVDPWGRGRMHLPTIHRVRLDAPGAAIQGSIHPTGFTVVVPGRKVLDNGRGIAKRDKRIVQVRARDGGGGAQITFKFRDEVPPYRVRLRKDFVEFLISAPKDE